MNATIEKITINLGEKTIELSEAEARALYNKLHSLFGVVNVFPAIVKEYVQVPTYVPPWNPVWGDHHITCKAIGAGLTS